jgi:TonB family protein
MQTPDAPPDGRVPAPAGPSVISTGWLAGDSVFDRPDRRKLGRAIWVSIGLHAALFGIIILVLTLAPPETLDNIQQQVVHLVFVQQPGPGGGGGGSPKPAPPKPLEVAKRPLPPPAPVTVPPPPTTPPPPTPKMLAPIMTNTTNLMQATGANAVSLEAYGGGGNGGGLGSGNGAGVGPGQTNGFGGGAYQVGSGITSPEILKQVKPNYTPDAMKAKVQGDVWLDAVVNPDGTVSDVRVARSLDKSGLDQQAMIAARQWLFRPGHDRNGKAVPVIVTIVLEFRLR